MSDLEFPANLVVEFKDALVRTPSIDTVLTRALRPTDPNRSAGVYALEWMPGEYGIGFPPEPIDGQYVVHIQLLVKHADEEEARAQHSVLSKSIRAMVYRDRTLQVRLPQVSETDRGVTEKVLKWRIRAQRYLSNEVQGTFLYLSTTEVVVTTENGLS